MSKPSSRPNEPMTRPNSSKPTLPSPTCVRAFSLAWPCTPMHIRHASRPPSPTIACSKSAHFSHADCSCHIWPPSSLQLPTVLPMQSCSSLSWLATSRWTRPNELGQFRTSHLHNSGPTGKSSTQLQTIGHVPSKLSHIHLRAQFQPRHFSSRCMTLTCLYFFLFHA